MLLLAFRRRCFLWALWLMSAPAWVTLSAHEFAHKQNTRASDLERLCRRFSGRAYYKQMGVMVGRLSVARRGRYWHTQGRRVLPELRCAPTASCADDQGDFVKGCLARPVPLEALALPTKMMLSRAHFHEQRPRDT